VPTEKNAEFAKAYVPDAILSSSEVDLVGGVENTPAFYPEGTPILWGPKLAHDPGFIGSRTMALGGTSAAMFAAVGCYAPIPVCGPACPIDPFVYSVTVGLDGTPLIGNKLTLESPKAPHCGVAPYGISADPRSQPITVGQAAIKRPSKLYSEAVIWNGAKISMLNSLVAAPLGTDLQAADAINLNGQIAGWGTVAGQTYQAFILTPKT
jgi:hypothetical protein